MNLSAALLPKAKDKDRSRCHFRKSAPFSWLINQWISIEGFRLNWLWARSAFIHDAYSDFVQNTYMSKQTQNKCFEAGKFDFDYHENIKESWHDGNGHIFSEKHFRIWCYERATNYSQRCCLKLENNVSPDFLFVDPRSPRVSIVLFHFVGIWLIRKKNRFKKKFAKKKCSRSFVSVMSFTFWLFICSNHIFFPQSKHGNKHAENYKRTFIVEERYFPCFAVRVVNERIFIVEEW